MPHPARHALDAAGRNQAAAAAIIQRCGWRFRELKDLSDTPVVMRGLRWWGKGAVARGLEAGGWPGRRIIGPGNRLARNVLGLSLLAVVSMVHSLNAGTYDPYSAARIVQPRLSDPQKAALIAAGRALRTRNRPSDALTPEQVITLRQIDEMLKDEGDFLGVVGSLDFLAWLASTQEHTVATTLEIALDYGSPEEQLRARLLQIRIEHGQLPMTLAERAIERYAASLESVDLPGVVKAIRHSSLAPKELREPTWLRRLLASNKVPNRDGVGLQGASPRRPGRRHGQQGSLGRS
jgi:hypothetical protein